MSTGAVGRDRLWETAVDQHGYVTAAQAYEQGLSQPALAMLVRRGRLEREAHGVYRIPEVPTTRYDPFALAVFWTGVDEACLSHDTALAAYEVRDINPDRIHLTVAKHRRIRRSGGDAYAVHYEDLRPEQIAWWQEVPTVTLPIAIEQCIRSEVPGYLLHQAVERGSARGQINKNDERRLNAMLKP